jgi:soluble lytic murein transglycosylase-like protein
VTANDRYDSLFRWYAARYTVDWLMLKSIAKKESTFNPDAVNPKSGAVGLFQFMPNTWKEWNDGTVGVQPLVAVSIDHRLLDPRDPEDSTLAAAAYIKWLKLRYGNDVPEMLSGFDWGPGNTTKCIQRYGFDNWMHYLPPETADYIVRVSQYHQEYIEAENGGNV